MANSEPQTLILAIPGTPETQELDFQSIRDAIARGEIGLDHWAWCPAHNDWLPLGQISGFAALNSEVDEEPIRDGEIATTVPDQPEPVPVPKVARMSATPVIGMPNQLPATYYSRPMEESHEFPIFKTLFFVLGLAIVAMVGVNYYLIDQPYHENLAKTSFASIQTHAHLGAFVQPNALLIHVFPSKEINSDNFADLLTTLTQCTPSEALKGTPFISVALTSSWLSEYVMSAEDWKSFANMAGLSADEKKIYVLKHLEKNDGSPLVTYLKKDSPDVRKAREAKAWNDLVTHFQLKSS